MLALQKVTNGYRRQFQAQYSKRQSCKYGVHTTPSRPSYGNQPSDGRLVPGIMAVSRRMLALQVRRQAAPLRELVVQQVVAGRSLSFETRASAGGEAGVCGVAGVFWMVRY